MTNQLGSFGSFNNALTEVNLLINFASKCERLPNEYAALNKSALLLLTSKFEVFVEDVVKEYIEEINSMNLTNLLISEQLKIKHSITRIKDLVDFIENPSKNDKKVEVFKDLAQLWSDQEITFAGLDIPNKFNYGKHGSKEMQKLFSNIEIENIFETIVLYSDNEHSLLEDEQVIDFKGIINNITSQRNNITHQDKTPNMTHQQIGEYVDYFNRFSKELCQYLEGKLYSMRQELEAYKQVAAQRESAS
ncbi:MAE_28990/MAE_18760 family HEPN-like nuclease [Paenibacillus sp. BC26]|uniref:MAE_28990/MAE_18760 family HEPN-like nuclease n=1 Tax=Paenibacillus sp. BC26 TaxID=1881032 RepID=UPI0008E72D1B|nr:MAE_28990/MAE_18760 family HEPN-like nuclease [Paenibacillus sp. BC26]SFT19181.1 hypothetical protein SAMN05428962_5008 [Paenibacillus sp. BC26]